jgi:hypothetical protein
VKKAIILLAISAFILNPFIISVSNAQAKAVPVMTLRDGRVVSMTSAQLSALGAQPGVTIAAEPTIGASQVAIPIPAALGGGYIVGTPSAIASGLEATGIATKVTASSIVGATTAEGAVKAGSLAGTVATLGSTGTVVLGAVIVAGVIGGIAAIAGGGGGGDGGGGAAHHAPAYH